MLNDQTLQIVIELIRAAAAIIPAVLWFIRTR